MTRSDEFKKWVRIMEGTEIPAAISAETSSSCDCNSWDCDTCFPDTDNTPQSGQDGVKIADIVQTTEFRPTTAAVNDVSPDTDMGVALDNVSIDEEVDTSDIEALVAQLRTGEITYDEFKDRLESLEHTDYSMRQGEMGLSGDDTPAGNRAWGREQHEWDGIDDGFDDDDSFDDEFDEQNLEVGNQIELTEVDPVEQFKQSGGNVQEFPYGASSGAEVQTPQSEFAHTMANSTMNGDEAEELATKIMSVQNLGLSKSSTQYSMEDLMSLDQDKLSSLYSEIVGTPASAQPELAEGVDQDVMAWMQRFNKLGKL